MPTLTQSSARASAARPPAARRWLALSVLCLSLLIVTLDNTVLNVVLPTLVRDLDATTSQLQWIVDSYVLVFAGLLLVAGSVADRVGRKRTFLAGLAVFGAGSTWAAFSGSVGMLMAARASMGVGGALIMPSTLAIITTIFTDGSERRRAIGLWAATSGLGLALGPIIGGLLLARFWWGSVFLINVPIAALAAALAIPLVPDSRNTAATRPDVAGAVGSIAGIGLLLWSIIEAPSEGWTSPLVRATGLAGLAVLAAFAWWERRTSHPMLRLEFFRRPSFSAAVASVALANVGLFGALFVLTQFLQFDLAYTPLQAGIRVLPAAGAIALVAPLSAVLLRAIGTKLTIAAGLVIVGVGLWQISTASLTTTYSGTIGGMIMLGVGAGLVIPSATASVMASVPAAHTGVGSATNGTFLQLGGALGVAVIGSVLNATYQGHVTAALTPLHVPRVIMDTVAGSVGGALAVAAHLGGSVATELADLARSAFIDGMDLGLAVAAVVALLGAVLALVWLPDRDRPADGAAQDPEDERPARVQDHRLYGDLTQAGFDDGRQAPRKTATGLKSEARDVS